MNFDRIKNEAALIVALVASIALSVQDVTVNGQVSWRNLVPIIVGAVIRQRVTGPKTREQIDEYTRQLEEFLKALGAEIHKDDQPKDQ